MNNSSLGIILNYYFYKETSLILDVFTKNYGRISLVAKGARRESSKYKGKIIYFQTLELDWGGKGDLFTLYNLDWTGKNKIFTGHQLINAYYLNELLFKLLPKAEENINIFNLYNDTLILLSNTENSIPILRNYEYSFLDYLGYKPRLETEIDNNKPISEHLHYQYVLDLGPKQVQVSDGKLIFSGDSLIKIKNRNWKDMKVLNDAKLLFREIINNIIGYKKVYSRELVNFFYNDKSKR